MRIRLVVLVTAFVAALLYGWQANRSSAVPYEGLDGGAPLNVGFYVHKYSDCASRLDPVNVVFYGHGGLDPTHDGYTLSHFQYNLGWGQTTFNESKYFYDSGRCTTNDADVADGWVWESRNHARLENIANRDLGSTSIGGAHNETTQCGGHAVLATVNGWSGYDEARRNIWFGLNDHHFAYDQYWGNTRDFAQCGGQWTAASNGNVKYFSVPNYAYP